MSVTTGEALSARDRLGVSFKAAMASVRRLRGRESQGPGALSHAQYSLLFGLADRALYRAKDSGRDGCVAYHGNEV